MGERDVGGDQTLPLSHNHPRLLVSSYYLTPFFPFKHFLCFSRERKEETESIKRDRRERERQ
ncbi:hypothetical protein Hdeb2414_s0006g00205281 [Helianthus debilis subsp. tardiflorus]